MKVDILAFGAHPDDVELGCGGTIAKAISKGKKIGIIDLTRGELGTRGNAEIRGKEAKDAAKILGVKFRKNLNFSDGFIQNDRESQEKVIEVLRLYKPEIVLCNAIKDRHVDHSRASDLISNSCFLSGLEKLKTVKGGSFLNHSWRPKHVFHYIQWEDLTPDFVLDISGFLEIKMKAVKAFKSQVYDKESSETETPTSSINFLNSIESRAKNLGRLIFSDAAEGFTSERILAVEDFDALL